MRGFISYEEMESHCYGFLQHIVMLKSALYFADEPSMSYQDAAAV
jgi:hypothetical protein